LLNIKNIISFLPALQIPYAAPVNNFGLQKSTSRNKYANNTRLNLREPRQTKKALQKIAGP
jgi:hypothetical protein